jgi:uncharacterized protein (DUF1697 family)
MALVAFLRGVNVGGYKTFRPSVLAEELAEFDVVSIGAAGTFVIRQRVTQARLRAELASRLPFESEIMICRGSDVLRLMSQQHFGRRPPRTDIVRFVSVLSGNPRLDPGLPVSLPSPGRWLLKVLAREGRFVFGEYRRQMSAIRYLGEIDHLFGVSATTRNWNTINAIARVLQDR